jgi:hypothetical protein
MLESTLNHLTFVAALESKDQIDAGSVTGPPVGADGGGTNTAESSEVDEDPRLAPSASESADTRTIHQVIGCD